MCCWWDGEAFCSEINHYQRHVFIFQAVVWVLCALPSNFWFGFFFRIGLVRVWRVGKENGSNSFCCLEQGSGLSPLAVRSRAVHVLWCSCSRETRQSCSCWPASWHSQFFCRWHLAAGCSPLSVQYLSCGTCQSICAEILR